MTSRSEFKYLLFPILLPLVFFWHELFGLTVFAGFDFTHLILPFQDFARQCLYHGELPHWNPYLFGGFPQLAEGEGGLFYPGNALLWLPGDQAAWLSRTVLLHLILTGCLMYAFLRGRGASKPTACWLALFYQFLPGLLLRAETVGLFEAVAWLPGFYWAIERAVEDGVGKSRSRWLLWTLFASAQIGFMLLAGSSQIAFYAMVGSVFYLTGVVIKGPSVKARFFFALSTFVIAAGLGASLAAIQLMPTSTLAPISFRVQGADIGYYRIGTWLNFPRLASLFLFPAVKSTDGLLDYVTSLGYVGLLPFVLAGMALSLHRRNMNPILPPFFLAFFGLLLAFGFNFSGYENLITFPGFRLFRALGRMILPAEIAVFAVAAVGLDALFGLKDDRVRKPLVLGAWVTSAVALVLVVWFVLYEKLPLSSFEIVGLILLALAVLVTLAGIVLHLKTRRSDWLVGLLAIWLLGEMILLAPARAALTMNVGAFAKMREALKLENSGIVKTSDRPLRVLVATDTDVWTPLLARLARSPISSGDELPIPALGNEFALGGVGTVDGYTPLITERWFELSQDYMARGLSDVSDASNRLRNILAITCTDAVVAPPTFIGGDSFAESGVDLKGAFPDGWHLLKAPEPVPFASIPRHVDATDEADWDSFKRWIVGPDYVPGEFALVEADARNRESLGMHWGESAAGSETTGLFLEPPVRMDVPDAVVPEVISVERGNSHVAVRAGCDSPCWLVVRESYMPGWEARVDGERSRVYPADYVFCGVPLRAGEHTVEMTYTTPGLRGGAVISLVAWVVWLIAVMIGKFGKASSVK